MKPEFRSDLAVERRRADTSLPGTELTEEHRGAFTVTRLAVKTEGSAEAVGGAPGHYVTVSFPDLTASDGAVRNAWLWGC